MVSLKINRGLEANLPNKISDGKIYFCVDTGNIYIDYNQTRIHTNANKAKALTYFDTETNEYVDMDAQTILEIIENCKSAYVQDDEPEDAPNGSLWVDTDENPENKEAESIPIFDLVQLGLPVLVVDQGPQTLTVDTLLMQQALHKGFAKFELQGDLGNGPENFSSIVTATFFRNIYQITKSFWVDNGNNDVRIRLIINVATDGVQAWIETESDILNLPIAEEGVF